jgi:hypothetical protein
MHDYISLLNKNEKDKTEKTMKKIKVNEKKLLKTIHDQKLSEMVQRR